MGRKPNDSLIQPIDDRLAMKEGVDIRTGSQSGSNSMISVVHPAGLSNETQQRRDQELTPFEGESFPTVGCAKYASADRCQSV